MERIDGTIQTSGSPHVVVIPIACPPPGVIDGVVRRLARVFGVRASVRPPYLDYSSAMLPVRDQYDSPTLMRRLLRAFPSTGGKIIGVTNLDLCNPILSFVYGEAQLDGPVAIVSTCRLAEAPWTDQLLRRIEIEAVHELGHTFGLGHCVHNWCAMYPSSSVREIDAKSPALCVECQKTAGLAGASTANA